MKSKMLLRGSFLAAVLVTTASVPELCGATVSDDFSNGLNQALWTTIGNSQLYTLDVSQGEVRISKPAGGDYSRLFSGLQFLPAVQGDFDVAVDFRDAAIKRTDGTPGNQIQLNVQIGNQLVALVRSDEESAGQNVHVFQDPPQTWVGTQATVVNSGRLQITRVGIQLSAFLDGNLIYQGNYNNEAATISFVLQNNGTVDPTAVTFDNFSITYTNAAISGRVTDNNQQALPGAAVLLMGDSSGSTITDGKGEYHFDGLTAGGSYKVFPYLENYSFSPDEVLFPALDQAEVADFVGAFDPNWQLPAVDLPAVFSGITLTLNKALYEPGDSLTAVLDLDAYSSPKNELPAVLVALPGGDVELLNLVQTDPGRYATLEPTAVESAAGDGSVRFDGKLSVAPGDKVVAIWYVKDLNPGGPPVEEDMIYDHALTLNPDFPDSPTTILPELAMSDDELSPPPGGKPLATLMGRGGFPVQVPVNELIVYPRDQEDLNKFLAFANGTVLASNDDPQNDPDTKSLPAVLVQVDPSSMDLRFLPQLRDLFGHGGELFSSNAGGSRIFELALLSQMEGFIVMLNPRLQLAGVPQVSEQFEGTMSENLSLSPEEVLNVPKLWSFMSLFDFDERRIPLAILDMGFAPNPDFRGFDEGDVFGCSVQVTGVDCSAGAAEGIPTVGNSFFGDRTWHGTGVTTISGGVLNNGWGSAGVGGQVVVPMLYKYDLGSYVFGIGTGIRHATLDGASVINLSASYPCNLQTELGSFNICDPAARAALCATVTATVAAASSVACTATAWIPIVGAVVCTAATTATVAAGSACAALVAAGDVREPMRSAVRFAADRGVPVVTVAGNALDPARLPAVIRDLVDLTDPRVETWQIYPAMIPDTIVAASTDAFWPFANNNFFGDRVDVWAPIRASYFAPPTTTSTAPFTEHILYKDGLGGTSAAAPFVSGVIAAMQATNPGLNRNTPGLTITQIRSIVGRIKVLLVTTAWTPTGLADLAPNDAIRTEVEAASEERRNLVNPLRAVQTAAAEAGLPDFAALGYETSLGLSELDSVDAADSEAEAHEVPTSGAWSDGFYSMPGERLAPTWQDGDWFHFVGPGTTPGLYEQRFQLRVPRGFDAPMVYPARFRLFLSALTPQEQIFQLVSPLIPNGANSRFRIHGAGLQDNLYQLSRAGFARIGDLPQADRFDRNDPILTPPESRPDNNLTSRAANLGNPGEFAWQFIRGTSFGDYWGITIPDLSIHTLTDVDYFALTNFPAFTLTGNSACDPYLEIHFDDSVLATVTTPDGSIVVRDQPSPVTVSVFALLEGRLILKFAAPPEQVARYHFDCRFYTTDPRICAIASALGDARAAGEARGSGVFEFPGVLPDLPSFGPGAYAGLPARNIDQLGHITTPDGYLINWRESGHFTAAFELLSGDSLWLRLVDASGNVMAESRTANLLGGTPLQLNGPVPNDAGTPDPGISLLLDAPDLPAGDYLLLVSHGTLGTRVNMLLPAGAVQDGSPSLESVQAGPQPEPPTISFTPGPNGILFSWPAGQFPFELNVRSGFGLNDTWLPAVQVPQQNGENNEVLITPGPDTQFYRLSLPAVVEP